MSLLLLALAFQQPAKSDAEELTALMKRTKVSVELENAPIEDLVEIVRQHLNKNFVVSPKVWGEHSSEDLRISVKLKEVSVHTLLRVTLRPRDLTVTVSEGVLMVVPRSAVTEEIITKIYDIRDLVLPIRDFTPPQVPWGIQGSADGSGATFSSIFGSLADGGEEDDGGATLDTIQQLVEAHTGGDSWTEHPKAALSFVNGMMVVSQTKKTHEEIDRLLASLRKMR